MLQSLVKASAGSLEVLFGDGEPTSATATLTYLDIDPDSATFGEMVDAFATAKAVALEGIADALDADVAVKATSITLGDASDVYAGQRLIIGAANDPSPREVVRVKRVDAQLVTLTAPLVFAHLDGDFVGSMRGTVAVTALEAVTFWADGFLTVTPNTGDPITEAPIDCGLTKIPDALFDLSDVRQIYPKVLSILDGALDVQGAVREARDRMLMTFGADRARWTLGGSMFRQAGALQFLLDRASMLGPQFKDVPVDMWRTMLAEELARLRAYMPVDKNQDGTPNDPDGSDTLGMAAVEAVVRWAAWQVLLCTGSRSLG